MAAADDHVDLVWLLRHGEFGVLQLGAQGVLPAGKAGGDGGDLTPVPSSSSLAPAPASDKTQTAATCGMSGNMPCKCLAFPHNCRTLPGESAPSSVVKSIIDNANFRAATFDSFLILRF